MKRIAVITLLIVLMLLPTVSAHADINTRLNGEGIAPYALTADETELLSAFGLTGNAHALAYNAPDEARSVSINVYTMVENGKWSLGGGGILYGDVGESLNGLITIVIKQDALMELRMINNSMSSFTSAPIEQFDKVIASSVEFLEDHQAIELEKEIPVAMMVYDMNYEDGAAMGTFMLDDYYNPERFEGMDAVRVVTLMFSAKADIGMSIAPHQAPTEEMLDGLPVDSSITSDAPATTDNIGKLRHDILLEGGWEFGGATYEYKEDGISKHMGKMLSVDLPDNSDLFDLEISPEGQYTQRIIVDDAMKITMRNEYIGVDDDLLKYVHSIYGDTGNIQHLSMEAVSSYPAEHIHFEDRRIDDISSVDIVKVTTEQHVHYFIMSVPLDKVDQYTSVRDVILAAVQIVEH